MRPKQRPPSSLRRAATTGFVAALAVAAVASCSGGDNPTSIPTTSGAGPSSGRSGTTGTDVPGTAPTTVVRRPAGTAPPGTTVGTTPGTAPPGTNVDLPNQSILPDEEAEDVTWTANATDHQGDDGLLVAYDCTPDGIDATVWGDRVYTDDSSVCTAAVYEGLITIERGGRVVIQITAGRSRYDAGTANGITTLEYGNWPGSFWFPGT